MKTILLSTALFTFGYLGAQVKSTEKQIIVEGKDTTTIIKDVLEGNLERQTIIQSADKSITTIEDLVDGTQKQTIIQGADTTIFITKKSEDISIDEMGDIKIDDQNDSTKIKIGNKKIVIVESKNGDKKGEKKVIIDERVIIENDEDAPEVALNDEDDENEDDNENGKAHWAGLGINSNGFMNADNKIVSGTDAGFLEQDFARSIGVNFNFLEKRFPIFKQYIGVTTGLGLQWNRYALKNNVDVVSSDSLLYGVTNTTVDYKKNVLRATYLQAPLLLEFATNKDDKKAWHLAAGVVGGVRIGSSWKTKWEDGGKTNKNKVKSNHHFNPFQAYATAIVGYHNVSLYVNYGLTQVFEKNKGPEYTAVSAGVLFNF